MPPSPEKTASPAFRSAGSDSKNFSAKNWPPCFSASGDKHLFQGERSWPDGDMVLEKEILEQQKRLMGGYRYTIRFSLTPEGENCFRLFSESMLQEGLEITGLFVQGPDGSRVSLPYTAQGTTKYDFELEHHLNDYPHLCYGWRMEV